MTDWQPIETAPRDGSALLLYVPGVRSWNRLTGMPDIVVGRWDREDTWFAGAHEPGGWFSDIGDVNSGYESTGAYFEHELLRPTKWMLLPDPPQEAEGVIDESMLKRWPSVSVWRSGL